MDNFDSKLKYDYLSPKPTGLGFFWVSHIGRASKVIWKDDISELLEPLRSLHTVEEKHSL